jgi:hypothetical protein
VLSVSSFKPPGKRQGLQDVQILEQRVHGGSLRRWLAEVCLRGHRLPCTHHSPQARFRPSSKSNEIVVSLSYWTRRSQPSAQPPTTMKFPLCGARLLVAQERCAGSSRHHEILELVVWYIAGGAETREDELKKARSDGWLQAGSQTTLSLGLVRELLEIDYGGWSRLKTHR